MTRLTICITTYNRWELCLNALKSICGQNEVDFEVILVDDCSTDPIPNNVADIFEDRHVRYVRHDRNLGLATARNTALELANGVFFSFCDDDDSWPDGLAGRLLKAMETGPSDVGMAVAVSPSAFGAKCDHFQGYPRLRHLMLQGYTPPVGSQIYRTDLVRKVGGYNPRVRSGVDHDLWISLAKLDPRVAPAWGEPARVGSDFSRNRMTTDIQRRRPGIVKSLEIWKPQIIEVFGKKFYQHFYRSYLQYLDYCSYKHALRSKDYVQVMVSALKPSVMVRIFEKFFRKKMHLPKRHLFPEFKG